MTSIVAVIVDFLAHATEESVETSLVAFGKECSIITFSTAPPTRNWIGNPDNVCLDHLRIVGFLFDDGRQGRIADEVVCIIHPVIVASVEAIVDVLSNDERCSPESRSNGN